MAMAAKEAAALPAAELVGLVPVLVLLVARAEPALALKAAAVLVGLWVLQVLVVVLEVRRSRRRAAPARRPERTIRSRRARNLPR